MATDSELKETLKKLSAAVDALAKGTKSSSGGRDPAVKGPDFLSMSKSIKTYEQALEDTIKKSNRMSNDMSAAYKEFNAEFAKLGKVTSKTTDDLEKVNDMYRSHSKYMSAILDSDKLSNKAQDVLLDKLKKVSEKFDDLGGNLAKNIKGMGTMAEFLDSNAKSLVNLGNVLKDHIEITEDNVDAMDQNITTLKEMAEKNQLTTKTVQDVKKAQDKLKDATEEHKKKLVKLGVATDAQLTSNNDIVKAYKKQIAQAKGSQDAQNELIADLDTFMATLQNASDLTATAIKKEIDQRNGLAKAAHKSIAMTVDHEKAFAPLKSAIKSVTDEFNLLAFTSKITLGAGMALMLEGIKKMYGEFTGVAQLGLARNFAGLAGSSLKLGVSIKDLTDIAKANYNTYSKMGLDSFASSLETNRDALMKLGLSSAQAAKANAEMASNATLTGVDPKDSNALNASIRQQTDAFEKMRAITGESSDAFNSQLKTMLASESVGKSLLGMNKQERIQRVGDLMQMQRQYRLLGLTNEQTQKALDAQASKADMGAGDRISGSYQLQMGASLVGMDPQKAKRLQYLESKTKLDANGGTAQTEELTALRAEMQQRILDKKQAAIAEQSNDATSGSGTAKLEMLNQLTERLNSNKLSAQAMDTGKDVAKAKAEGLAANPADVQRSLEIGRMTDEEVKVVKGVEDLQNIMSSGFAKVALGLASIAASLVIAFGKSAASMKATRSGGIDAAPAAAGAAKAGGGVGGMLKGGLGMVGKALPWVAAGAAVFEGITGALDGVAKAATIFGTTAATDSQKVAAGIGGALSALTGGLIPTDATAKFIDNVTGNFGKFLSDGLDLFLDNVPKVFEYIANTAIPGMIKMLSNGLSSLFSAVFNGGGFWEGVKSIFSGTGRESFVTKILGYFTDALHFAAVALVKGIGSIFSKLGIGGSDFAKWVSSDTEFGDASQRPSAKAGPTKSLPDRAVSAVGGLASTMTSSVVPGSTGGNIGNLSQSDSAKFANTLAKRESGGKIDSVNTLGYAGKYQFGASALADMGILDKDKVAAMQKAKMSNKAIMGDESVWKNQGGRQAFLSDEGLQDATFSKYTNQHYNELVKAGVITSSTPKEEVSGYLMAAHLKGVGGAKAFAKGNDNADAYGTRTSDYFKLGSAALGTDTPGVHAATDWSRSSPTTGTGAWAQASQGISVWQSGAIPSYPTSTPTNRVNNPATAQQVAQQTTQEQARAQAPGVSIADQTVKLLQIIADNTTSMKNNVLNRGSSNPAMRQSVFGNATTYNDTVNQM